MKVTITPKTAKGSVTAPPSKSMTHRLLIGAALAEGESAISRMGDSQDIQATLQCLSAFGSSYHREGDTLYLSGIRWREKADWIACSCLESGSTLRFLLPLALLNGKTVQFQGSQKLLQRPLAPYEQLCHAQGFLFEKTETSLTVRGNLKAGSYSLAGNLSSQFLSGYLFALPLLTGESELKLTTPLESRPYVEMTRAVLQQFGITSVWQGEQCLRISGKQQYQAGKFTVEGDYSQTAFWEALKELGGAVEVTGLAEDSVQGDRCYRSYFTALRNKHAILDMADCPDLAPILFVLAALQQGGTFVGTRRLALKESDRGRAMQEEFQKCGIAMEIGENHIFVPHQGLHPPRETLYGHNDHRIVMALAILLTQLGGSIEGVEAVAKSYPDFFQQLRALGIPWQ